MPRVPDRILNCAFYLYATAEDARIGMNFGGTGFIVGLNSTRYPGRWHYCYAISNRHVTVDFPVVRLNTLDGRTEIFDFGPEDWIMHPDGFDISAVSLAVDGTKQKIGVIAIEAFATHENIEKRHVGAGDDVFMIGRFVDHDGGEVNMPAIRFGNISVMPSNIFHKVSNKVLESYCLDMHSRTGFSGSPVFVYHTPGSNLEDIVEHRGLNLGMATLYFLGIHWGQVPERWTVLEKTETIENDITTSVETVVKGLSGMTLVDPSWRILELLLIDKFKSARDYTELQLPNILGEDNTPALEAGNDDQEIET